MIKKFTLLILATLCLAGTAQAGEYVVYQPTTPESVYWTSESDYNQPEITIPVIAAGDAIKIYVTNVASDFSYNVIWRGKTSVNDWAWATLFSGSSCNNGVITYTVAAVGSYTINEANYSATADEVATSLKERKMILTGKFKLLAVTVESASVQSTSQTFFTGQSYDQGNWTWDNRIVLSPVTYNFAALKAGDVLNIGYTTASTVGSNDVHGQLSVTNGTTTIGDTGYNDTPSQASTLSITLTDAMITQLRAGETRITGQNVTVNSMTSTSLELGVTTTLANAETDFGTAWSTYLEMKDLITDYSNVSEGDVLAISYTTDASNAGKIQLQYKWGKYAEYDLAANTTSTLYIPITSDLLTKLDEDNIQIKGYYTTASANGISILHFMTPAGYRPVYIPAGGYATFYGASNCALPTGVQAYYVSEVSSTKATLFEIDNIPANQGVILKGSTGIYQLYTTDEAASVSDNKLSGAVTRQQITDVSNKYVLYDNSGSPEFRKITADTYLDAYKCYLATVSEARTISIGFDDGTTSIADVPLMNKAEQDGIFNLQGQRVSNPRKGIYIVNGKKVFMK